MAKNPRTISFINNLRNGVFVRKMRQKDPMKYYSGLQQTITICNIVTSFHVAAAQPLRDKMQSYKWHCVTLSITSH